MRTLQLVAHGRLALAPEGERGAAAALAVVHCHLVRLLLLLLLLVLLNQSPGLLVLALVIRVREGQHSNGRRDIGSARLLLAAGSIRHRRSLVVDCIV